MTLERGAIRIESAHAANYFTLQEERVKNHAATIKFINPKMMKIQAEKVETEEILFYQENLNPPDPFLAEGSLEVLKEETRVQSNKQNDLRFLLEKEVQAEEEDPQRTDLYILAQVTQEEERAGTFSPMKQELNLKIQDTRNTKWRQDPELQEKLQMREFIKHQIKLAIIPEPVFNPISYPNYQHTVYMEVEETKLIKEIIQEKNLFTRISLLARPLDPRWVLASIPSVLKNFRSMAKISTILFQEEERKIILKRIYRSVANMVLIQTERNFAFATITFPFRSMTSQILLVNAIENTPCRSQCGANCLTILVRPVKAKIIYLPDIKKDPHILQEELQEFSGRELPTPSLASPMQGLLPKKQEKVEQVRRILKAWETYPTSSFISKTKMVIKLKTEKTPGTSLKMYRAIASQATRNLSKQNSS